MFGSVTSCFEVSLPPLTLLWQEAREIVATIRIMPVIRSNRFRICNNSRTNFGCKTVFEEDFSSTFLSARSTDISFNVRLKMDDKYLSEL